MAPTPKNFAAKIITTIHRNFSYSPFEVNVFPNFELSLLIQSKKAIIEMTIPTRAIVPNRDDKKYGKII